MKEMRVWLWQFSLVPWKRNQNAALGCVLFFFEYPQCAKKHDGSCCKLLVSSEFNSVEDPLEES